MTIPLQPTADSGKENENYNENYDNIDNDNYNNNNSSPPSADKERLCDQNQNLTAAIIITTTNRGELTWIADLDIFGDFIRIRILNCTLVAITFETNCILEDDHHQQIIKIILTMA